MFVPAMQQAPAPQAFFGGIGGCSNGFHLQVPQQQQLPPPAWQQQPRLQHPPQLPLGSAAASLPRDPRELAQLADEFCARYPIDGNAMDYLLTSPLEVQARVVQEFRPPREGEPDYSALLTSFVKRCRGDARAAFGAPLPAAGVYEQVHLPEVLDIPRPESLGHYGGPQDPRGLAGTPPSQEVLAAFLTRYPVDDRACDYFSCQRADVQDRVLREFRPPREGEADYSSLFMAFVKRCRGDARFATPLHPAPVAYAGPCGGGFGCGGCSFPGGCSGGLPPRTAWQQQQQEAPAAVPGGSLSLEAFVARYPIDERACDYFGSSPAEVQERVLREFRPPREGEADYSSLFMAFVKRCRQGPRFEAPLLLPQHLAPRGPGVGGGCWYGGGGCFGGCAGGYAGAPLIGCGAAPGGACGGCGFTVLSSGPEGIEAFRRRFPIDQQTVAFLSESSAEVRDRVLNTFVPPRPDDTDFSAAVLAYVRECRRALGPGPGLPELAGGGCSTGGSSSPLADAAAGPASSPGGQQGQDELGSFLRRYPVDARALDYLAASSPGVVGRVVREFQPKQEGDADYSALVMAFTKRCRGEERFGMGACAGGGCFGGEPAWKRARAF